MNAIEISNVSKKYKNVTALNNISFRFEHGKIYGLLGRNGAGKSTLLKILTNRIFATEGTVTIDGDTAIENAAMQNKLFCMSEADLYPLTLKVKEVFHWTAQFYVTFDMEKALRLAAEFKLDLNKRIKALSTGYKSIMKLIIALSVKVPYVAFDEPVLGLDANHRELFYKLLLENYENEEKTIILATHLIEEVSGIIEDVVIIDKGKLLLQDSVENIKAQGYSIAGSVQDIKKYCEGENVIGQDELGGMSIAYIMGPVRQEKLHDRLHLSAMNLQKLFVKLTEKEGE